ncbi:TolC family protein [Pseudomonas sp. NPDC089734]|uniref:TolC family protein n=1 Tax=Pseudomonas sp. NPDC089734 TaxID=3364469 RepID=UPI0037F6959D
MRVLIPLTLWLAAVSPLAMAYQPDVFGTGKEVASLPGQAAGAACGLPPIGTGLTLENAIEHVLCNDPQVRLAWANAKSQAAQIGIARSAWLPRLDGSLSSSRGHQAFDYDDAPRLSDSGRYRSNSQGLALSWVLFDFGRRSATLNRTQQLLAAANASQDAALQNSFVVASQAYYETLAAQRTLAAARQVEKLAAQNFEAADAKYKAGAAALSDRLQAQTALSQARLRVIRDEGTYTNSSGVLALRMGLSPRLQLNLTGDLDTVPDSSFANSIDDLLAEARRNNPALIAASAQMKASQAAIDESRAAGRPTLSLVGNLTDSHNTQPATANGDLRQRDRGIGIQLNIPLFEGFERSYQIRDAMARHEASQAQVADTEQRVALETWGYYQTLSIETRSLQRTQELVEQSRQSLEVVQGRYQAGVGSMIELLNALTAYANSEQEHIQSLSSWQTARLSLAASLGRLNLSMLQ